MKVLNLYAGIGGNRKLWKDCEVTAVELNTEVAEIYKYFFPDDNVIVGDAHEYLRLHFREFDFIWASPPCPTHSVLQMTRYYDEKLKYPDMSLYQEIVWLQTFFKGNWVIENVKPYYKPFIQPSFCLGRHYFWSNKLFFDINISDGRIGKKWHKYTEEDWSKIHGFDLSKIKIANKRQILRNCVYPEIGEYIFNKIRES